VMKKLKNLLVIKLIISILPMDAIGLLIDPEMLCNV
jgi:hypothetical protein